MIKDLQSLIIKGKHRFWRPFMIKYDCQRICEIGVRKGRNFRRMIDHHPQVAVAVDCWIDDGVKPRNDILLTQSDLDKQYEDFKERMTKFHFVDIRRGYSFEVVKDFPDEYFDLIYIDADHSYEGCSRDLNDWYPKLRHGGYFLGDDYRRKHIPAVRFGVIEAVNEFTEKHGLSLFHLPRDNWGAIKP